MVDMYERFGTGVHGAGECTYFKYEGPGDGCALQILQKCGNRAHPLLCPAGGVVIWWTYCFFSFFHVVLSHCRVLSSSSNTVKNCLQHTAASHKPRYRPVMASLFDRTAGQEGFSWQEDIYTSQKIDKKSGR